MSRIAELAAVVVLKKEKTSLEKELLMEQSNLKLLHERTRCPLIEGAISKCKQRIVSREGELWDINEALRGGGYL